MSCAAATHASRFPLQANEKELMMSGTCGPISRRQFAEYDPDTSSWRMWPDTGLWGSIAYSETWPTSGMTRSGAAFELQTSVPHIDASGCSSLPTPRASRGASTTELSYALGGERSDQDRPQGQVLLPTPRATDGTKGGPNQRGSSGDLMLPSAVVSL